MTLPCKLVSLPVRRDARGALSFVEVGGHIGFEIRREFHLFGLKNGIARGGHAHKTCHQFLIAMSGAFLITTDDGKFQQKWSLDSPECGLYVPPAQWLDLIPTSNNSVLSVLASLQYDEDDYIRERADFYRYLYILY